MVNKWRFLYVNMGIRFILHVVYVNLLVFFMYLRLNKSIARADLAAKLYVV